MNIQPNWTVTDQGPWQLIYNDTSIISLLEVEGITSTQGYIFAGTKEECEAEIIRLNLPWASGFVSPVDEENIEPTVVTETIYKLIHNGTHILWFSVDEESSNIEGTTIVGTFQECQQEIDRFGLTWPSDELFE
jgi:hypothetical protein